MVILSHLSWFSSVWYFIYLQTDMSTLGYLLVSHFKKEEGGGPWPGTTQNNISRIGLSKFPPIYKKYEVVVLIRWVPCLLQAAGRGCGLIFRSARVLTLSVSSAVLHTTCARALLRASPDSWSKHFVADICSPKANKKTQPLCVLLANRGWCERVKTEGGFFFVFFFVVGQGGHVHVFVWM